MSVNRTSEGVLGLIPARAGSKGIPGKNLRPFLNRPLVLHTIEVAVASRLLTDIAVTTDSPKIAEIAADRGISVIHRPAELAGDDVPMMPVVEHAVLAREAVLGHLFSTVVILQPTSPLRWPEDVDGAIGKLLETGADCIVTVARSREHPLKARRIVNDLLVPFFDEEPVGGLRQNLAVSWRRNGAVYVIRREPGFDPDPIRSPGVRPYIMPIERSVDIDDLMDFELAEWLAERSG